MFVTTKEAAEILKLSERRIQAMIAQKILPADKFGRAWLIKRTAVEHLSQAERSPGRPRKS